MRTPRVDSPVFCVVVYLLTRFPVVAQAPRNSQPVAFVHLTIVDAVEGRLLPNMTIVVQGDRITRVEESSAFRAPADAKLVDARGKFAIPGLWDMHVHLSWATESALPILLANGVTSVRDTGSRLSETDGWRTEISTGIRPGPRIVRTGPILNGQSFNQYQMVVGNPDEARGVVRALKAAGVDFIKIHRRIPRDSYFALMDEARKQDIRVVGHVPLTVKPEEASDAGQASIEHTETLFEGAVTNGELLDLTGESIRKYLAEHGSALFAKFVANHTVVTPTLGAWKGEIAARDGSVPDPNVRYIAASLRRIPVEPLNLPLKEVFDGLCDAVRQMHSTGVTLMVGTDVSAAPRIPGFLMHDELATLAACGLTPAEALRAATLVPATLLGRQSEIGTIQVGKIADIVLLSENPLDDIRNSRKIWTVVAAGKVLQRGDLDRLLRAAERLPATH